MANVRCDTRAHGRVQGRNWNQEFNSFYDQVMEIITGPMADMIIQSMMVRTMGVHRDMYTDYSYQQSTSSKRWVCY